MFAWAGFNGEGQTTATREEQAFAFARRQQELPFPGERRKAAATGSMVVLSCFIRSFIDAFVSTVRPCSAPRKSATSWVTVMSPR